MPYQGNYRIISNVEVAPGNFCMAINAPQIARNAKPGQFIGVATNGVGGASGLILRRPLSIHRVKKEAVEVIYQVIGKGTKALSNRISGDMLDVIGPLGKGFDLPKGKGQKIILVAGGMGVAPLVFLAEKLRILRTPNPELRTLVLLGARTKKLLLCEDEFKKAGCDVKIATDDGSKGRKGFVTDLLEDFLRVTIYACGPHPMLKQVARISKQHNVPAQVSLEERMACGFGACLGCAVKMKGERYKMVCKDGPVFNANEVAW